ncbi:hypothetical protein E2562_000834 [Oryza meyeriana var. granulata]|uniref:non-specific serine/threonine protein kinase n=1 Tax=Oryza meyeriana var. granulata TaxID=110450 RepID=A0A6G1CZX0_9ORYZ|nr:hypothetical protein E2562_000834 [Oryza meyeriana var. granulata]
MHLELLLLPILASLQLLTTFANGSTVDAGCPPARCGNLTITYPFWLGSQDQSSCGPPAFRLTCNDTASSPFLSSSYIKVLDVDYGRRSLVAVHALLAADAACTVMFNVSSAFAITDRFSISRSNRQLYVLSRCRERLPPLGSVPVTNCRANSSGMYAYLGDNYVTGQAPANDGGCELSVFPVLGSSKATEMTAANYRQLIVGGFLLEWEPVGDCNTCRASGGQCRYDANTAAFACLCSDGSMRPSVCDGKYKGRLALIVSLAAVGGLGPKRALVYEYMPNGSLEKYIYSESSKLDTRWEMLLKIAIGIARGLEYLHQGCNTRIIHFDIKPCNILLDHEFCPKIADFGLAKLCHLNESILSMAEARGTIGFIAPETISTSSEGSSDV